MNYIDEDTAFERWCENNYLPILSQAIWKKLFKRFNRSGWCEWVTVDNPTLMAEVQIRREETFIDYRNKLVEAGLIEYIKGKKGSPNKYKLTPFEKYTFTTGVQTGVESGVNSGVQTGVESGVQSRDITKQDNTKPNKTKDIPPIPPDIDLEALIDGYTKDVELATVFREYVQHRKSTKSPLTELVLQKMFKKLDKLGYTDSQKIECLNESIMNGWKGIFELKQSGVQPQDKNGQYKTAYERTMDTARTSIERYQNGEVKKIDI